MSLSLELAKKEERDARIVMEWRNDSEARKMFYGQEPKVWESFWPEYYNEYFDSENIHPCFAILDSEKIAFLRSSLYESKIEGKITYNIGINMSLKFRGKGYGSEVLNLFCDYIFEQGVEVIIAEVKKINPISKRAFLKSNFILYDEMIKKTRGIEVEIYRLIKRKSC